MIDLSECVLGAGIDPSTGYSQRRINGKLWYVHRLVWIKTHGPIPAGMHIHHRCGTKACINVEHLEMLAPEDHFALARKCDHDRVQRPNCQSRCRICENEKRNELRRKRRKSGVSRADRDKAMAC